VHRTSMPVLLLLFLVMFLVVLLQLLLHKTLQHLHPLLLIIGPCRTLPACMHAYMLWVI
jgi:hypothetical protein